MALHYGKPDGAHDRLVGKSWEAFKFFNAGEGNDTVISGPGRAAVRAHMGDGDDYFFASRPVRVDVFGGAGDNIVDISRAGTSTVWFGTDPGVGHDPQPSRPGDIHRADLNPNARQIVNVEGCGDTEVVIITNVNVNTKHVVVSGHIFDLEMEHIAFGYRDDFVFLKSMVVDSPSGPELRLHFEPPTNSQFSNPTWDERPAFGENSTLDPGYMDNFHGPSDLGFLFV